MNNQTQNLIGDESKADTSQAVHAVVVRFAGDSGDGIQVTGSRFTQETARLGNDLATRPDFPAEIRAPAGSLPGVSAFQIQFGDNRIYTAGDSSDVLVAMNPAALKTNLSELKPNGVLICNEDSFQKRNWERAGYDSNPLDSEELKTRFTLVSVPMTSLTHEALKDIEITKSSADRCKNFFALGIVCWLYSRGIEETLAWIDKKFGKDPIVAEANKEALRGGMAFAEAAEIFPAPTEVAPSKLAPGTYRNITGNQGLAYGLVAASQLSGKSLFYSGYPITPASDILHEVSRHKDFGAMTFQAEDEISACCAAIGAAYGGKLAVTTSSGPGILLKQEAIGLAVMAELPLVIVDVQRAGPSTGMPTKTEQSDLLMTLFGRNGECPLVVLSVSCAEDAFDTAIEACSIALSRMTPVFLLSDGYIGNSAGPWCIPSVESLPQITPRGVDEIKEGEEFHPYMRDPETLARAWAVPGMTGKEHRIGGLEKQDLTGNISYDPVNHQSMTNLRAEKVARVADSYAPIKVDGEDQGDLLVIGWGSTYGAIAAAVNRSRASGLSVSHLHLRHLNPFPNDLESVMSKFKEVLVPELNMGQLSLLLRAKFLRDVKSYSKVQGQPFKVEELMAEFERVVRGEA